MRKIKDVLRLKFEAHLSHRQIAAATGLWKAAVTKDLTRAAEVGLGWPLPLDLDDAEAERLLFPMSAATSPHEPAAPDGAAPLATPPLKRAVTNLLRAHPEFTPVWGIQGGNAAALSP